MFVISSTRAAFLVAAWLATTATTPAWAQNWRGASFSGGGRNVQLNNAPRTGSKPAMISRPTSSWPSRLPSATPITRSASTSIPNVSKPASATPIARPALSSIPSIKNLGSGQLTPLPPVQPQPFPKPGRPPGKPRPSAQATAVAVAVSVGGGGGGTCPPPACSHPPVCTPAPCYPVTPAVTYVAPAAPTAADFFELARTEFRKGDYAQALSAIDQAIGLLPKQADLYQFRSLILFAQGEYVPSAAAAYTALSAGPGWNWKSLYSYYGDADLYTQHLRALQTATAANPESAEHHFLLGYHCLMLDQVEAGRKRLERVLELRPDEQLTKNLLAMLPQNS